ncbi:DUF1738 domain-containing protein [Burkholderia cenocepacia]|uniref:zincin-like metallopeptidase domain-containing protein n=1 Tax=Burkholderia cenocepacia TaxID=95486 RepID=UPI002860DF25|nr:zincin-like metallopeptidase domain-containing protein [Burkholderia cenocepacia]MDR8076761.1 DUF1738 domain-containing protein [Burkholderia cenocepacia]
MKLYKDKNHLQNLLAHFIENYESFAETGEFKKGFKVTNNDMPTNAFSGHRYRGINAFFLCMMGHEDNRWASANQIINYNKENGTNLRWSGGGVPIFAYVDKIIAYSKKEIDANIQTDNLTEEEIKKLKQGEPITRKVLAYSTTVFNANQIQGLPPVQKVSEDFTGNEKMENIILAMQDAGIPLHRHNEDRAFYSPSRHAVYVPHDNNFYTKEFLNEVLLHEFVHATGHESILDRDTLKNYAKDKSFRAREEMIAEFGSFIGAKTFGVSYNTQSDVNHAAYIKDWLSVLKGKDGIKELTTAFYHAGQGVDWMGQRIDEYNLKLEQKEKLAIVGIKTKSDNQKINDNQKLSLSM